MHKVHFTYRRITSAQLPTVTDLDGTVRPATDAELLNMGIHRVAPGLYSCVHQEQRQPSGSWAVVGDPHTGEELSRGLLPQRHATLPNHVRAQLMGADGTYPHTWHGEPRR